MSLWSLWWVWMVGALALAILEVLAPAQIFLGFAAGAAGVGDRLSRPVTVRAGLLNLEKAAGGNDLTRAATGAAGDHLSVLAHAVAGTRGARHQLF